MSLIRVDTGVVDDRLDPKFADGVHDLAPSGIALALEVDPALPRHDERAHNRSARADVVARHDRRYQEVATGLALIHEHMRMCQLPSQSSEGTDLVVYTM